MSINFKYLVLNYKSAFGMKSLCKE
uniref:Uncharacterized protein n=1 Tax=Arundo donax TaxID=35708 RepID=A0A0A9GME4_ARUDO